MTKRPKITEDPIVAELKEVRLALRDLDHVVLDMAQLLDKLLSQQQALDQAASFARAQHVANIRRFMSGRWNRRDGDHFATVLPPPKKGGKDADRKTGDL